MEIERKYLIPRLPDLNKASRAIEIEQGYISTQPVIRIRRADDRYILTCKGKGLMAREEFELLLSESEYRHLTTKLDAPLLRKTRYHFPYETSTIELDVFHDHLDGLVMAEVEFPSMEKADSFTPPAWFGQDVTMDTRYQNSQLVRRKSAEGLMPRE